MTVHDQKAKLGVGTTHLRECGMQVFVPPSYFTDTLFRIFNILETRWAINVFQGVVAACAYRTNP